LLSVASMLTDPFGTNVITRKIIGCAIRVHAVVGPGVFENVYSECLEYELQHEGLPYETNRAVPVIYKGVRLRSKYYIDIVVEGLVVVELKAVAALAEIHVRQVLTQLKLTDLPVGLLLNFNVVTLKEGGIKRVVNPKYAKELPAYEIGG
jgi:GxxExxY protein